MVKTKCEEMKSVNLDVVSGERLEKLDDEVKMSWLMAKYGSKVIASDQSKYAHYNNTEVSEKQLIKDGNDLFNTKILDCTHAEYAHVKPHTFTELQVYGWQLLTSYQFALESSQREAILMPTSTLKLDVALKA